MQMIFQFLPFDTLCIPEVKKLCFLVFWLLLLSSQLLRVFPKVSPYYLLLNRHLSIVQLMLLLGHILLFGQ